MSMHLDAIDLLKHDHRVVKQMFLDYEIAKSDEQRRGVVEILIGELRQEIDHHVAEEDSQFMPAPRNAVDQQALDELGGKLGKAKRMAPTRPHPNIPDQPPGEAVVGALAAVHDRVRDRVQGRPIT